MSDLLVALQGAARTWQPAAGAQPRLIVAGAGGALGRAVLRDSLACSTFAAVGVLTCAPLQAGLRGLHPIPHGPFAAPPGPGGLRAEVAIVVFDRARDPHGRDAAFHLPAPEGLLALAQGLRARGVHTLAVVRPIAPSSLPAALQHGLATLDEQVLTSVGFDRLLFVRPTQDAPHRSLRAGPERLAHWMLSQLRWMIPAQERPVRADAVAAFVLEALRQWLALPSAAGGTRVAAAPLLWAAAQPGRLRPTVADWLHGAPPSGQLRAAAGGAAPIIDR